MRPFPPASNGRRPRWLAEMIFVWLLAAAGSAARAYVLQGQEWPANQPIVMDLGLGVSGTLMDGSTSWNQVAEAALAVWNPYLGSGVQFQYVSTGATPTRGDGKNSVFFSPTVYGDSFGDETLGITISYYYPANNLKTESDVIFNSAQPFNSYRGPLRYNASGGYVFDLRRVAIHEFGHVLGLNHVAQSAASIMTPFTTDYDTVQADDIAGVQAIYGTLDAPAITSLLAVSTAFDRSFSYQITASNQPTNFSVSTLPTGLNFNAATGLISGAPTVVGTFPLTLGATNRAGTGSASLLLKVVAVDSVPTVTLTATTPDITVGSGEIGVFTVTLSAVQDVDVFVNYTIKGSAINGTDYVQLSGTKKIKAGKISRPIKVIPLGALDGAAKKVVKLTLSSGDGYTVAATTFIKITERLPTE